MEAGGTGRESPLVKGNPGYTLRVCGGPFFRQRGLYGFRRRRNGGGRRSGGGRRDCFGCNCRLDVFSELWRKGRKKERDPEGEG